VPHGKAPFLSLSTSPLRNKFESIEELDGSMQANAITPQKIKYMLRNLKEG
jgi:hypothetical protein